MITAQMSGQLFRFQAVVLRLLFEEDGTSLIKLQRPGAVTRDFTLDCFNSRKGTCGNLFRTVHDELKNVCIV